jgi:hypothetical protein
VPICDNHGNGRTEPKGGHRIRSAAHGLPMRRPFVWASLLLAVAVLVGLVLQLYFIAAWIYGSGSSRALDAHKDAGAFVVHPPGDLRVRGGAHRLVGHLEERPLVARALTGPHPALLTEATR